MTDPIKVRSMSNKSFRGRSQSMTRESNGIQKKLQSWKFADIREIKSQIKKPSDTKKDKTKKEKDYKYKKIGQKKLMIL